MAETAVSIVIEHVLPLVVQEVRLQKGFHSKVTSIRGQLEIIQSFLKDADIRAEKEDESNVVKTCVKQVREGAYQIEDVIDEYILHFVKQPFGKKAMLPFSPEFFSICQKTESKICDSL